MPSIVPLKSTIARSPVRGRARDPFVARALPAQHLDRAVDVVGAHFRLRPLDGDVGEVADPHFRIDLEYRREFQPVGSGGLGLGLDPRQAGDAQVLLPYRIGERGLHRVGNDIGTDLRAVLLGDHLDRHLAGPETGHLGVLGQTRQTLLDLALDLCHRHRHGQPALELAEGLQTGLHTRRILANVNRWCERGDSNPHGLSRWNLNPVRLPIPPLSQPLSPNG